MLYDTSMHSAALSAHMLADPDLQRLTSALSSDVRWCKENAAMTTSYSAFVCFRKLSMSERWKKTGEAL